MMEGEWATGERPDHHEKEPWVAALITHAVSFPTDPLLLSLRAAGRSREAALRDGDRRRKTKGPGVEWRKRLPIPVSPHSPSVPSVQREWMKCNDQRTGEEGERDSASRQKINSWPRVRRAEMRRCLSPPSLRSLILTYGSGSLGTTNRVTEWQGTPGEMEKVRLRS